MSFASIQKSMLYSVRSFRSQNTVLISQFSAHAYDTITHTNHCIKRRISRYQMFSAFPFSTYHGSVGKGERIRTVEEDEQFDDKPPGKDQFMTGPNPGLVSVISQGIKSLEHTAEEIQYKTRKITLSQPHRKPSFRNGRAAEMDPRQLAEGQRILDVASDCLEQLTLQNEKNSLQRRNVGGGGNGLVLFGEPIVLLDCEVNRNIRQAKIYWTLPYGILLDNRINQRLYQEIMVKVQKQLVENGGAKLLAKNVHTRLSYYYPPRIKLFPATDEMVQKAIQEFMV